MHRACSRPTLNSSMSSIDHWLRGVSIIVPYKQFGTFLLLPFQSVIGDGNAYGGGPLSDFSTDFKLVANCCVSANACIVAICCVLAIACIVAVCSPLNHYRLQLCFSLLRSSIKSEASQIKSPQECFTFALLFHHEPSRVRLSCPDFRSHKLYSLKAFLPLSCH